MNKIELEKIKEKALENHIPIIMDDTLEVIEKILLEEKPKRILELGTATGYSSITTNSIYGTERHLLKSESLKRKYLHLAE